MGLPPKGSQYHKNLLQEEQNTRLFPIGKSPPKSYNKKSALKRKSNRDNFGRIGKRIYKILFRS